MQIGVSTASLYPMILEESIEYLVSHNVKTIEIFVNTHSELAPDYVGKIRTMLDNYGAKCVALHPYTCGMEPMMLFSEYERRVPDFLEYHRRYFDAMNTLGAEIFVLHGNKFEIEIPFDRYMERFLKLYMLGKEYGITVAQENVVRCTSRDLDFLVEMKKALGKMANFVFDVKQAVRAGMNIETALELLGSNIIHIHISDHDRLEDCKLIGTGDFNVPLFFNRLENFGFSGSIILELYRKNYAEYRDVIDNFRLLEKMYNIN